MRARLRSLRIRLALLGFVAIYGPVLFLWSVVAVVEEVSVSDLGDGAGTEIQTSRSPSSSPFVLGTVVILAPCAGALAWWWSGRAIRPIGAIQATIDDIDSGGLDRRIGLEKGSTEVVALAGSFDGMLDRLERAAQLQNQLIEETSHELRTPLAILRTNADVLLGQPDPSEHDYRTALERSRTTAVRLTAIIEELLVDARGRARTIVREPSDLASLAQTAADSTEPLARSRNVSIEVIAPVELPCAVDRSSLERAIANLIDNAVRHSPSGRGVTVEVVDDGLSALVAVSDLGPGIAPEDQPHVFDRYWQDSVDTESPGLGLTIVKHVAEAHGGSVRVASSGLSGSGARFELRVPTGTP